MKKCFFSSLLSSFLFYLLSVNAFAKEAEKVHLSLISESNAAGKEQTLLLGLDAQMTPGWKTYWRSPGVGGYGFKLNWEDSKNIQSAQILWPLPHHFPTQVGQVNAYEGNVIFPLLATVADPGQPVHISVSVDMLVCDQSNCLPVMKTLTLDLPKGPKSESRQAAILRQAMEEIPKREALGDQILGGLLRLQGVEVEAKSSPPILHVTLSKTEGIFSKEDLPELFLEINGLFVDAPQVSLSKNQKTAQYAALIYSDANRSPTLLPGLEGKPVTLTVSYQNKGFEVQHILKDQSFSLNFWGGMLFIAFLGGLILNIMPCVLPVLSLKIFSVMRQGGRHHATVRQEFLATVFGILFSFLLLASGAILLKASGHAVGWGVQFQNPYFLIGLIGILTLFACNLFGFFEFRLPSALSSSLGGISSHKESLPGSFLEGSLAAILATPCTAPFLGTALAFALSQGTFEILSTFTAMGLGLAFPFLLVAFFPKLAAKLPKPGPWMLKIKYGLGLLVILTIIWLAYVLVAEIGKAGTALIALLMLLLSLSLKNNHRGSEARKKMAWLAATFLIATSFALPTLLPRHVSSVSFQKNGVWRPFEAGRISSYVNAGKTVFVSITADWCLTCQANKYFTLSNKEVLEALHHKEVVAMEADWTNHDPQITDYLKEFNQYGIPFYAVYGCQTPKGEFLGQLITPQKVLDALKREKCPVLKQG